MRRPISLTDADTTSCATVTLWPTAHRFRTGHRIRVQVSSGAFPCYNRNPGPGPPPPPSAPPTNSSSDGRTDHAVAAMLGQTRSFIHDFATASEVAKDTGEPFAAMESEYPHHANDWSLLVSAHTTMRRNGSAS
ncbi:CocE/NonD family hydrolase C-terminal non-catalytic domain-containing protein [Streptomyces sp. NPDC005760]|uniref:CocE/NonD family hydrolase C-terminal non-catalytic domain-containing protein n=1 Tax=Streptomyces sp. NPDC005760 TaxID=3156718 RepID=UPI0033F5C44E